MFYRYMGLVEMNVFSFYRFKIDLPYSRKLTRYEINAVFKYLLINFIYLNFLLNVDYYHNR